MSDIDDKLLRIFDDNNDDIGGMSVDDDDDDISALLPSNRNKTVNKINDKKAAEKKKEKPVKQEKKKELKPRPKIDIDKLFEDSSEPKGFLISSDELSPPPSEPKQSFVEQDVDIPKPPESLQQLEKNMIKYIDDSIKRVKAQFLDELKYSISKTSEEDSAISAFILGIPHDVDEIVAEELKSYHRPSIQSTSQIDSSLETHLSLVKKVLQVQEKEMQQLPLSAEKIAELDQSVNRAIAQLDNKIRIPLESFKLERNDAAMMNNFYSDKNIGNQQMTPSKMRLYEAEATLHQLDVATDLFERRKARVLEEHETWRTLQADVEAPSPHDNDLIEIQQIAERINSNLSQSKADPSSTSISKVAASISQEVNAIARASQQIEVEMKKLSKKVSKRKGAQVYIPPPVHHKKQAREEDSIEDEFIGEIRERLRIVAKKHDRMLK